MKCLRDHLNLLSELMYTPVAGFKKVASVMLSQHCGKSSMISYSLTNVLVID